MLAEAVSADPDRRALVVRPGVLTLADAAPASMLGELGVYKAVERHRAAATNAGQARPALTGVLVAPPSTCAATAHPGWSEAGGEELPAQT